MTTVDVGSTVWVRGAVVNGGGGWHQGTLLEVRKLASDQNQLVAFVKLKEGDRRLSTWFDVADVAIEGPLCFSSSSSLSTSSQMLLADAVGGVLLNPSAHAAIPPAERNNCPVIDFLEKRLARDIKTPNSVREIHYLCRTFHPWYYAPFGLLYPDFSPLLTDIVHDVYLCPFTLKPFTTEAQMRSEIESSCGSRPHPPGKEIYRDNAQGVTLLEVDGSLHKTFCRNLFLISKSFLEKKLAGHDVDLYMFYVLCVHQRFAPEFCSDRRAMYFAGYFSVEKEDTEHNLACIVTLPCFQGFGFGNFLIAASYELAYQRGMVGTPERPLSDLGQVAYDKYWQEQIFHWMGSVLDAERAKQQEGVSAAAAAGLGGADSDSDAGSGSEVQLVKVVQPGSSPTTTHETLLSTTVRRIAKSVRLDERDVLDTVLKMGLVHRCAEKQALSLFVPAAAVKTMESRYRLKGAVHFSARKLHK